MPPVPQAVVSDDAQHAAYHETGDPLLEAALCKRYAGLAQMLADRFARPGADRDDLRQAALTALLLALRRFDPARGVSFTTFAWSTISGELKRFHRGNGWALQVSRRVQEAHLAVATATEDLTHDLGRSPTVEELAARTGLSPEHVIEALEARSAFRPLSIDAPLSEDENRWQLGRLDEGMGAVDDADMVERILARLTPRERHLVEMRFERGLSQREIAEVLGVSQMQVSRLLAAVTTKLRARASLMSR